MPPPFPVAIHQFVFSIHHCYIIISNRSSSSVIILDLMRQLVRSAWCTHLHNQIFINCLIDILIRNILLLTDRPIEQWLAKNCYLIKSSTLLTGRYCLQIAYLSRPYPPITRKSKVVLLHTSLQTCIVAFFTNSLKNSFDFFFCLKLGHQKMGSSSLVRGNQLLYTYST